MKTIVSIVTAALTATLWAGQAQGWASANRYGGSTSHSWGSTSHANAWGGSTSHTWGQGTSHTNAYGGSTSHSYYGGTSHTNVYGGFDVRKVRVGLGAHVSFRCDCLSSSRVLPLPDASRLPGVSDLSGLSPAGRGAVLLVGLLRLRSSRRRDRGRCRWSGSSVGQHGSRDFERVLGGCCRRQRRHGRGDQRGLQRWGCHRGHHGGRAGVGHLRDGRQLCDVCPRAR